MSATLTSSPVTTTDTVTNSATPARSRSAVRSIWKATGLSGIAVTIVAAVARAAGAGLEVDGERIPCSGSLN